MEQQEFSVDDIIAEVKAGLLDETAPEEERKLPVDKKKEPKKQPGGVAKVFKVLGRIALVLLETVLLVVIALYGVMFVLAKGPSPTARNLFVMSVQETSAMGWLANLYFTEEEIAAMKSAGEDVVYEETDTSLIQIAPPVVDDTQGPQPDAWGLIDEDGDGIIIQPVKGDGYSGFMMVVLDPSRVIMGSVPDSFGERGYTVEEMVGYYGAVAGVNAGGFYDPDGFGDGSIPDSMVVFEGEIYYSELGVRKGFVGIDSNHILHVGKLTPDQIRERDIQYGVCFGPVLINNGEPCEVEGGGLNPRTAIGQRSDGAILLLVIDGRQAISMGATFQDLVDIFLEYGAVNACNLDGGSSSLMWFDGGYVNNCASVIGIRPVPTTFLVLPEGVNGNEE